MVIEFSHYSVDALMPLHVSVDTLAQANEEARKRPWTPDAFEKDVTSAFKLAKGQRRGDEVSAAKFVSSLQLLRAKYSTKLIYKKSKHRKNVKEMDETLSESTNSSDFPEAKILEKSDEAPHSKKITQ